MLERLLGGQSQRIYAVTRMLFGLMFAFHGMQKILGILARSQPEVMSQLWIGGVIELVGGLLVAVGLVTRWAAFLASGTMAVAYFQYHWKLDLDERFFPGVNHGELAVVYCFFFLCVASSGPGKWSLDAVIGRRRSQ